MFKWTQKFSVGVGEMDEQHKHFIELANKSIESAGKMDLSEEELQKQVDAFVDYILYHLSSEEKYFNEFDCTNSAHIAAHDAFRETIKKFQLQLKAGGISVRDLAEELAVFSGNWLMEHILVMDKGYTTCFHDHGLK